MIIKLNPKHVALSLFFFIGVITALNFLGLYAIYFMGKEGVFGLVDMFRLNAESNIPTFYSAIALFWSGILFLLVGLELRKKLEPFWIHWVGLALIFFFLAFDESAQIHELLDHHRNWTNGLFEAKGALAGPWVVVYGILILLFIICYGRFFLSLSKKYKTIFGSAGLIFVSGAIGLEMAGAVEWTENRFSFAFETINSVEEILEMVGIVLVIYGLLTYIREKFGTIQIRI